MLRITLKDLQNLKDNDGITLVNGVSVTYRNGYQVATEGIETTDAEIFSSAKEILAEYNISLSKVFELAEIKLEYIFFDTNDNLIATFQLDYIDFYGM